MIETTYEKRESNTIEDDSRDLSFINFQSCYGSNAAKVKEKSIDSSINAVAITNRDGIITYVNHSLMHMFGYAAMDILGKSIVVLWKRKGKYVEVMDAILEHDGWVGELEAERHDRSVFYVQLSGTVVRDETDTPLALMASFVDITERKKALEKIQESERLKTEFMNIAAHELKTPLIPIQGYLEMLQHIPTLSEEHRQWIQICLKNVDNLRTIVDDILDVSRLEANSMKFTFSDVDLGSLLEEVAVDMGPMIEKQGITFTIQNSTPHLLVHADAQRLKQVVRNLLSNAIRFATNKSIRIDVHVHPKEAHISVIDTGIGIAKENISKLFQKFSQVGDAETRQSKGTGLGLYICKKIVEAHQGWIKAESKGEGQGTTITVSLPLKNPT